MAKEIDLDKELYSFEVKVLKEVKESTSKTDEVSGETVTTSKNVKKEVPVRIVLKKPTRKLVERAELAYTVKLSELMKLGVMTRAMVTKKYADTGGVLTEADAKYLTDKYKRIADIQKDFVGLSIKSDRLTDEEREKLSAVTDEINALRREIAELESNYSFIFQHTADMKTMAHVVLFYTLMLSYIEENVDGKPELTPFFKGDTFEEKMEDFYKKEEELTSLYAQVKHKLAYFVSFWYNGAIASRDDFVKLDKDIEEGKV